MKLDETTNRKVSEIVKRMGKAETELRDCIGELKMLTYGCQTFEFDGDVVDRGMFDEWEHVLESIDKFCFFV